MNNGQITKNTQMPRRAPRPRCRQGLRSLLLSMLRNDGKGQMFAGPAREDRGRLLRSSIVRRSRTWLVGMSCLLLVLRGESQTPPDKSGVKSSVISLPSGAGSIEGLGESFEPQLNTGGSSYAISIALPPGRAGLAPTVRLTYQSFAGNGVAGLGWALDFSSLQRQTDKGFPEYNDGDTFVFEGEELVPLSNQDQDWRCENERNFQRLRRIDGDGDGILDAWEVTERDGIRHTLGRFRGLTNRWSVVEHPDLAGANPFDRTYVWLIDSTTDLHGNRMEYEYVQGNGRLYPSRITYGHLGENYHEILFAYEDRPDPFEDYRPTFSALLDRRLTRIEVRSQGQLVRAYRFAYDYEAGDLTPEVEARQSGYLDLGVSLLRRVTQIDRTGDDAHHLPPLVFLYSGLDLTQSERRGLASPPELDLADPNGRVQLADLDGDALPDLFATAAEGAGQVQKVALNRGESRLDGTPRLSFAPARLVAGSSPVDLAQPNTVVHDPKGKGLVDLSCLMEDGLNKRLETFGNRARLDFVDEDRLGFSAENLDTTVLENPPAFVTYGSAATRLMDANFDKRSDFVNLEPSFGAMRVRSFFLNRVGEWVLNESFLPASYPLANTFDGPDGQPNPCVHLADMNGDRLLDLVCLAPEASGSGQRLTVKYWPLRGLGRYGEERIMAAAEFDAFEIGDADLRDVLLDDITGDGLADVVVLDGSGPETVLSLRVNLAGQRWSQPYTRAGLPRYAPRDAVAPTLVRLADLNANGSLDILFRNPGLEDSWEYLELLPAGQPQLMTGIDNGIGKRTTITYGSAAEDEQMARESGHPWRTFAPLALQVVRQIRATSGQDLNGDGQEDASVMEFRYRDPFYDGFEREFRGFAFAQRIDYGDDFVPDPVTGLMQVSAGWETSRTPTGQVSGPSLVRRYRFYTGAADQRDNDDYGEEVPFLPQTDEFTFVGGREEEPLKGLQWIEEQIDPVVLHSALDGGFDAGCEAATLAETLEDRGRLTPDAYVYARLRQDWTLRRLYRPTEAVPYLADQDADGVMEDYRNAPASPVPAGRFEGQGITVLPGSSRSVSYAFLSRRLTEVREANALLAATLGYPEATAVRTEKVFDRDDYGNQILMRDLGTDDPAYDDELVTTLTYAHGGQALARWVINRPDTILVTDEHGAFVGRTDHYYDGENFVGIAGEIQDRALLHRMLDYIDPTNFVATTRSRFDIHGNIVESLDPRGNIRRVAWDEAFQTYAVSETMVVGPGAPELRREVEFDTGLGVVTASQDVNGHRTTYHYDPYGRLVKIVAPGDSLALPTTTYEYQPADPVRGRAYVYGGAGDLTLVPVPAGTVSRVTTRQREASGETSEILSALYTDGSGTALAMVEEGETEGTWIVQKATSYNLRGLVQAEWLPYQVSSADIPQFGVLWPAGRPPSTDGINPQVVATDYYYDPQGRAIRSVAPPETWGGPRREIATQYLPLEKRLYDEEDLRPGSPHEGTPRVEHYDSLGRLIAVDEIVRLNDDGTPAATPRVWTTRYAYDLNHQVTRMTDPQGNVKVMEYDGLKRKTFMNDPDRGSMTFEYDDASNLIETTDAKGQRISYTYDGLNRILTEDYHDENADGFRYARNPDVEYFYDVPAGPVDQGDGTRATARHTLGELAYVVDASGEEHRSYDERGRVEWMVKRVRAPGADASSQLTSYATHFDYDAADRVRALTYPDNDQVVYEYNARNLVRRIGGSSGPEILSAVAYLPSGQMKQLDYGNGVRTRLDYDPRMRLTNLVTTSQALPGSPRLIDFVYAFDGASNVRNIFDRRDTALIPTMDLRRNTQEFNYDDLYRLTGVRYNAPAGAGANGGEIQYRYDRIGNLLAQTSDIAHEEGGRSLTDLGQMSYGGAAGAANRVGRLSEDPAGPHALTSIHPAADGSRDYEYDPNGNMTVLDGLGCLWDFKDRLVVAENPSMRVRYTYDYADRRVVKRVAWKSEDGGNGEAEDPAAGTTRSEIYVGEHFEVRDDAQPVKYVFNGPIRVARVTGSLSNRDRVQRFQLEPGWNLLSLAVTANQALEQMIGAGSSAAGLLEADWIGRWNDAAADWVPVEPGETLAAGTVLWLHARTNAVMTLSGTYTEPTARIVAGGGTFIGGAGLETLPTAAWTGMGVDGWSFDGARQIWGSRVSDLAEIPAGEGGGTALKGCFPASLRPGQALFIRTAEAVELPADDATLRIRYYHQDHLGSSSVITDAAGALVQEAAYYPFGAPRHEYQPRGVREPYQFNQKERDEETGLFYFEARYLTGPLSRFLSPDPKYLHPDRLAGDATKEFLAHPQKLNLYSFALNNPVKYSDPTGLDPEEGSPIMDAVETLVDVAGFAADLGEELGHAKLKGPGVVLDVIGVGIKTAKFIDEPSLYNGAAATYDAGKAAITTYAPPVGLTLQAMDLAGVGPGSILDWGNEVAQQYEKNAKTWKSVGQSWNETQKAYEDLGRSYEAQARFYEAETRKLREETRQIQERTRQLQEQTRRAEEMIQRTEKLLRESKD